MRKVCVISISSLSVSFPPLHKTLSAFFCEIHNEGFFAAY